MTVEITGNGYQALFNNVKFIDSGESTSITVPVAGDLELDGYTLHFSNEGSKLTIGKDVYNFAKITISETEIDIKFENDTSSYTYSFYKDKVTLNGNKIDKCYLVLPDQGEDLDEETLVKAIDKCIYNSENPSGYYPMYTFDDYSLDGKYVAQKSYIEWLWYYLYDEDENYICDKECELHITTNNKGYTNKFVFSSDRAECQHKMARKDDSVDDNVMGYKFNETYIIDDTVFLCIDGKEIIQLLYTKGKGQYNFTTPCCLFDYALFGITTGIDNTYIVFTITYQALTVPTDDIFRCSEILDTSMISKSYAIDMLSKFNSYFDELPIPTPIDPIHFQYSGDEINSSGIEQLLKNGCYYIALIKVKKIDDGLEKGKKSYYSPVIFYYGIIIALFTSTKFEWAGELNIDLEGSKIFINDNDYYYTCRYIPNNGTFTTTGSTEYSDYTYNGYFDIISCYIYNPNYTPLSFNSKSRISLYSNIGITSAYENEIVSEAESKGYFEVENANDLKSDYEIAGAIFLIKFENGAMLSDKYDFENPLKVDVKGNTTSMSSNAFTDLMFTSEESSSYCFKLQWSSSDTNVSATVYGPDDYAYYQFKLNGGSTYNNNINYNYNAKTIGQTCIGMRFFFKPDLVQVSDDVIESNKFFSFSMAPNFLRVQTDHSLIHYIKKHYHSVICRYQRIKNVK